MSRTENLKRCVRTVIALLAVLVTVETAALSCEGQPGFAEIRVEITREAKIERPPDVIIYLEPGPEQDGQACWIVKNAGRRTLHLTAKPQDQQEDPPNWKDPFPGFSVILTRDRRESASPKPSITGSWAYALELKNRKGETLDLIDPVIVIKPGSSTMQPSD